MSGRWDTNPPNSWVPCGFHLVDYGVSRGLEVVRRGWLGTLSYNQARKFYGTAFGWSMNEIPEMHNTQVGTVEADMLGVRGKPKEPGAINGGMLERRDSVKSPVIYISVENIDETAATIEQNGGKVIQPRTPVGNFGFAAYFKDTEGNTVGLWQFA